MNSGRQWDEIVLRLRDLDHDVSHSRAPHVKTKKTLELARRIVQDYFREARPELRSLGVEEERFAALDILMQSLLRIANKTTRRQTVLDLIGQLRESATQLMTERDKKIGNAALQRHQRAGETSELESLIISTLERLVPSAALSYRQALLDLRTERVSYRGTANELRESLREVLDRLAPDDSLRAAGFKPESDKGQFTQRQKVRYIMRSRGALSGAGRTPEASVDVIENLTGTLARSVYDRTSISAHVSTARSEILQLKMYVETLLAELLAIHKERGLELSL